MICIHVTVSTKNQWSRTMFPNIFHSTAGVENKSTCLAYRWECPLWQQGSACPRPQPGHPEDRGDWYSRRVWLQHTLVEAPVYLKVSPLLLTFFIRQNSLNPAYSHVPHYLLFLFIHMQSQKGYFPVNWVLEIIMQWKNIDSSSLCSLWEMQR